MLGPVLNEAQPIWAVLESLRWQNGRSAKKLEAAGGRLGGLVEAKWVCRLSLMKARGDVEEARPDADSYFVQDLRTATRALQGAHDSEALSSAEKLGPALSPIMKDLRLLETARRLGEIVDGLQHIAASERWEIFNPRARTSGPTDWQWFESRLRAAPEDVHRALTAEDVRAVKDAVRNALGKAMGDASKQRLDQEMNDRSQGGDREPQSVTKEAERLAALVKEALDLLRKPVDDARKELAKLAPTVSQMAEQLAKETEKLQEKTTEEAQKAPEQKREDAKVAAQTTLAAQQALNEKVESFERRPARRCEPAGHYEERRARTGARCR